MDAWNLEQASMDDIMRRWPETIRVALHHKLLCIGCPIAQFHTLEDAIREHGLDGNLLRREMYAAIERDHLSRERPSANTIKR